MLHSKHDGHETTVKSADSKDWIRKLAASVVRRAPMDATNFLLVEPNDTVIAVLSTLEPRLAQKILRNFPLNALKR